MLSPMRTPVASPLGAVGLIVLVPLVALAILRTSGSFASVSGTGLPDPGAFTRLSLPVVQGLRDLASITTVGCLTVAAFCVPLAKRGGAPTLSPAINRLAAVAMFASAAWSLLNLALIALVYSDASGSPITRAGFTRGALLFAQNFDLGRYLLWGSGLAATVALGCALVRASGSYRFLAALVAVAATALWPMALAGHGSGSLNHDDLVNLQFIHLVAIGLWAGGLIGLVAAQRLLGGGLAVAASRFSRLALWCLIAVGSSGVAGALLRVPSWNALISTYGVLLAAKVVLLTAAAALGLAQRRKFLRQISSGHNYAFLKLAVAEVLVLGVSAGIGVALSRTPPPADGISVPLTAAESLTGRPLPPQLGAAEWFSQWRVDSLWLPITLLAVIWYLTAVRRLQRRGDSWSMGRTASWLVGWALFAWATNGAPGAYGQVLFSMHMVQHMTIATAVPTFLVLGAPVTLALRTTQRRRDGSYGPREWLLRLVHSFPARLVGHPIVASGLFIVSLVAFYYGPFFEQALASHTAHQIMVLHFLGSGYLFASCVIGSDPGIKRPPYPLRALLIMIVFGFHALFSVSMMASTTLLAGDWFRSLERNWGKSLAEDQYLGASLMWGMGEYPLGVMAVALVVSWVHADRRERRRFDRAEDRDGMRTASYNAYLEALAAGSGPAGPKSAAVGVSERALVVQADTQDEDHTA